MDELKKFVEHELYQAGLVEENPIGNELVDITTISELVQMFYEEKGENLTFEEIQDKLDELVRFCQ